MKKILFYSYLTITFLAINLFAENAIIKGRIVDSETGDVLPGANVLIKGTNFGAATDLRGNYIIGNVPPGEYTLRVSFIGYEAQELNIMVESGQTIVKDITLVYGKAVKGQLVVVTAQASGQYDAINQQLASNTITNVVSEARIRELPDVNAAESIGRLPGVAIERSGGEATKISIRGLSAKHNTVTVNGVRVPATGGDDRSVDLSLISSNMLDGIEVKKAITADMDGDALGGTVDLKLKEAPENLQFFGSAQGGYNRLQNTYGNYNFNANASNRFYAGLLGVIASFNADNYDRSADKFSGDYRQQTTVAGETEIVAQSISMREENVTRGRTGGSLLLDYRLPNGKITANSFYNRLHWDGLYRINRMDVNANRHYYDLELRGGTTSIFTGSFGMQQDFGWLRYDVSAARTASRSENPEEKVWNFVQEANAFEGAVYADTPPNEIPDIATNDSAKTGLANVWVYDTKREENQTSLQLNIEVPYRLGRQISGHIKLGGKFRWLDRLNDEEQTGRNGLHYGNNQGPNDILVALDEGAPEWNIEEIVDQYGLLPMWVFESAYSRTDFLDGEYPLGFVVDKSKMERATRILSDRPDIFKNMALGSRGRDYDGIERYQAGYIMAELNLGKYITFLPGIRWERDYSKYHGQRYREVTKNNIQQDPAELDSLTIERENEFWLPMVHLIANPTSWLKIRLARTETLARPDFIQYAPITTIDSYQSYVRAANSLLSPAQSTNWDASISVYQNHLGLLTISGFHKSIEDLIFQTRLWLKPALQEVMMEKFPGLNAPAAWYESSPDCDAYINNAFEAIYKGLEIDWQTHFWYLPSIFRGLVLNVNYTRIFSETEKQQYYLGKGDIIPGSWPPYRSTIMIDSTRTARMPGQPAHILNITMGYDFKGFSARLSYLYQTDRVTYLDRKPELDNFSGEYARWDLTLQQNIRWGLQIFANFTNLNARPDRNYRGNALTDPTYLEYYGLTMDGGIRYRF